MRRHHRWVKGRAPLLSKGAQLPTAGVAAQGCRKGVWCAAAPQVGEGQSRFPQELKTHLLVWHRSAGGVQGVRRHHRWVKGSTPLSAGGGLRLLPSPDSLAG